MRGCITFVVLLTACGSGPQKQESPPQPNAVFYNIDWTAAISYSGFYEQDNYEQTGKIRNAFADKMKQQCGNCSQDWVVRIEKFVGDCFH